MNNGPIAILALAVIFILASCAALGALGFGAIVDENGVRLGQPEAWARATAVADSASLARAATAQSMERENEQKRVAADATATGLAISAQATATMLPIANQAAGVRSMTLAWSGAIALLIVLLLGIALAAIMQRESDVIARTPAGTILRQRVPLEWRIASAVRLARTGQPLPIADTVLDTSRQLGPSVQPVPGQVPILANGAEQAEPTHYLDAARAADSVLATAAMFENPDVADKTRRERAKLADGRGAGSLGFGGLAQASAPPTQIMPGGAANTDAWMTAIAEAYGVTPAQLEGGPGPDGAAGVSDVPDGPDGNSWEIETPDGDVREGEPGFADVWGGRGE